jgi:hypothetical protein
VKLQKSELRAGCLAVETAFWLAASVAVHLTAVYVTVGKIPTDPGRDLGQALVAKCSDLSPDRAGQPAVATNRVVT